MDLDDLDGPSQVPSRTSKFAPKSSKLVPRPKPKPKLEPQASASKPEPQESVSKPDSRELDAPVSKKNEDGEDSHRPISTAPKSEAETSNGAVKMEIEDKPEAEEESKEEDPMDEDDVEEDMVVREIDVFFTPSIDANTQLYVLQYPLRPCWRPYEMDERCEEVRVKPVSAEVEVDLSMDLDSENCDSEYVSKLKMTKQTLSSSWKPPPATGYAVGVLIGDKLHLNPIHAVVQLRPSLEHLKSGGSKRKSNVTGNAEVTVKSEDVNEKSVAPSRKQNKLTESPTEQKSDDKDCWVPLKYHGSKSDLSARYLARMVAQESLPIRFTMSPYDYVSSLCPGAGNNVKSKGLSKRLLLSMPLEERVRKLLCEGPPVHRFSTLKHFAPDDSVEDVLGVLQKHAQLVQGLWVPRSLLLFPDDENKSFARDYVLCLFSTNSVISFSPVNVPAKIKDDVKSFLTMFAVERPSFKDWKFKEHTDVSFTKLYDDIVKRQEQDWVGMKERIASRLQQAGKGGPGTKNAITKPSLANKSVKSMNSGKGTTNFDKGVTRSASGTLTGRRTMSDETREALPKALHKLFQNHKVCSFQLICQGLRDLAVSQSTLPKADARIVVAAAYGVDAPPEELQEVISQVATNIHGFYVLKSSSDHPEYDQLRKVVIDLLLVRGPNAKLKKAEVFEAARLAFKREITNNEYNKVMTDFCESKGSAWVLKRGDGKPK